jgi:chloramphenicol O-acetyltransferase type B
MSRVQFNVGALRYALARVQKRLRLCALYDAQVHPTSVVEGGCQVINTRMARHSFCGYDCTLINVDIGAFCSIADQVYIGGSAHPVEYVSTSPVFLSHRDSVKAKFARHDYYNLPRTTVGNDVWIGFGARVRAGISIGHGSVIGMGSVVTRDVAPYTIVGGNPARRIRDRFTPQISEALLRLEWWSFDDEKLREAAELFRDPKALLEKHGYL